jgi:hypothetical protein
MKPHLSLHKSLVTTLSLFVLIAGVSAQAPKEELPDLIKKRNYVFRAQSANPTGGRTRQLTSEYDLRVKNDTIISFLPYFGRSFSAPIDPSRGGIDFTSTDFEYKEAEGKKGGWDINIKPKDAKDVQEMTLGVSENGYGTLTVRSNNRQSISFYGFIDKPRTPRKK